MRGLLSTLRMMCLEGDAPSSTRDLVSRPKAGVPASIINLVRIVFYVVTFDYWIAV